MSLFHAGLQPALDSNGNPISGATWYFYLSGTTTPVAVYSDAALTTSLGATVTADSSGRFAVIFLDDSSQYRAVLKNDSGTTITDVDPVTGGSPGFRNVRAYGAVGNGVADDRAAVQSAIDATATAGGGTVFLPVGTYYLTKDPTHSYCLSLPSNVFLMGEGFGTILKRGNSTAGTHVINAASVENVGVTNLCIDGNRDNNSTTGHGLRLGGVVNGVFHNLLIRETYHYGIGIQDGANSGIKISNVIIQDTGGDGIDIKNLGDITLAYDTGIGAFAVGNTVTGATSGTSAVIVAINGDTTSGTLTLDNDVATFTNDGNDYQDFIDGENLQVGGVTKAKANGTLAREQNEDVQLVNISIRRWGNDGDEATQAGCDCRGPIKIANLWMSEPVAADAVGLRFRQGELLGINGSGAHQASVSNFYIDMGAGATQYALYVAARNCKVSNGTISGGQKGIRVIETGFGASGVHVSGATSDGVSIEQSAADSLDADKAKLFDVDSGNNGSDGFYIETANVELHGCRAEGNTGYGVNVSSTANSFGMFGGSVALNTAGTVSDAGTNSRFRAVSGFEKTYTVAQLATLITSPVNGQRAFVTDATATTFASAPTGGGSNKVPVFYDGAWKIG